MKVFVYFTEPISAITHGESNILEDTDRRILPSVIKPIMTSNKTENECLISGTYVHPDLVPHLAMWVSTSFSLRVSKILHDVAVQQYKEALNNVNNQLLDTEVKLINSEFQHSITKTLHSVL